MKSLPTGLQAHLDSGATTMCWCWRLIRTDAVVLGFTDHDKDIEMDGTTFEAVSGFSAGEIKEAVGLSVDNMEVDTALTSTALNENDLAAGLYDDAKVEIFRVNWADVAQRVLLRSGSLGEVRRGQSFFTAEVRGLSHYLQQPKGRVYQFGCDAVLGDSRCGVDLSDPLYKGSGAILAIDDKRRFSASGLGAFNDDWFSRGLLTWTSGANQGRSVEVKLHLVSSSSVTIELWREMSELLTIADQFDVTAGCDKQFLTCRDRYTNVVNFRGFAHIPGNDFIVSYPNSDDPDNDGGSRV